MPVNGSTVNGGKTVSTIAYCTPYCPLLFVERRIIMNKSTSRKITNNAITSRIVGNIITSLRQQAENHTVTGTLADAVWKYQAAVYAEAEAAKAKAEADSKADAKAKAEAAVRAAKAARAKADKAAKVAKAKTEAAKARKEAKAEAKAELHASHKAVKAIKKIVVTASNELRISPEAAEAIRLDNEAKLAEHQAEAAKEAAKACEKKGCPTPKNPKHRPGKMPKLVLSDKLVAVFSKAIGRKPVDGDKADFLIAHAIWGRIKGCQSALAADADSKDSRRLESLDSGTITGIAECIQLMTGEEPDAGRLVSWIREHSFEFLAPWFKDQARFKKSTFASAKVWYKDLTWGADGIATFRPIKAMPIQLAESEVSRICKRDGRKLITIAMGDVELPEKWSLFSFNDLFVMNEERDLLRRFYAIMHDGIRTADGKRYMFVSQSAGATRNAEITLISVDESKADTSEGLWKAEVLPVWVELTGLSWTEMQRQLMDIDDKGVVWFNATKFTARLAVNGSDTKALAELCPEIDRKVRGWNVVTFEDPTADCKRMNIHAVNGQLVKDESGHKLTVGDGQAILSFQAVSHLNAAIGVPLYEAERFASLEREISVKACDKLEEVNGKLRIKSGMTSLTKDEVLNVIRALRDDKEFARLASRMSYAFQTRRQHAVEKGAMFGVYTCCMPMHDGSFADAAIPNSFIKASGSAWKDGSLMICNYLNNKKRYVSMSAQFLNALMFKNPNELNPVVDYWASEIAKVFEVETVEEVNPITGVVSKSSRPTATARKTAMALLNVIGDGNEDDSLVPMALKANSELMLDHHVQASMSRAFEKLYKEMLSGRLMVPGVYTYQACDMLGVLNQVEKFGLDNPELEAGTAYFNGFAGTVSTFRSPMTAPAQAVNCQCVPVDTYWYTRDLFIDNSKDGAWDRRAGSDYDGDTVAVVTEAATLPNGFQVGKVITEAVKDFGYDLCEEKHSARKVEWSYDNFAFEMCKGIHRDQTGIITNTNTKCWEVYHHLRGLVSHMLTHGLSKVEFYLPTDNLCGRDLSKDNDCFEKKWVGHGLDLSLASQGILRAPGLKQRKVSKNGKVEWISSNLDIVGTYDIQGIIELAMKWHNLGKLTCLFQGIEIDGGKTNYYAADHGYSKEEHDVKLCTPQMMCRSMLKGRDISMTARHNTFFSCSLVASLYERALGHYKSFLNTRKQSEKILTSYMNSLLSI